MNAGSRNTRTPWCAQRRTRLPYKGDARWKRKSSPITRQQQLLVWRRPGLAASVKPHSGICWYTAPEPCAACLRGHPPPGVAKSSATFIERFAAYVGISRTTRPQRGSFERAGGKVCRDGRARGCTWCSKSACRRLVRLSVQRLVHGRGLGKTGLRRQRWLMVRGWGIGG